MTGIVTLFTVILVSDLILIARLFLKFRFKKNTLSLDSHSLQQYYIVSYFLPY